MMKSKVLLTVLSFVLSCFLISGCANKQAGQAPKTTDPQKSAVTETVPGTAKAGDASGKAAGTESTTEKLVYVVPTDGSQTLKAVKTKVTVKNNQFGLGLAEAVIAQNAKSLPQGTKVLGLEVKDGLAKLNLNKEFAQKGQGENAQTMVVYALVNTLTELPEIKKVQFLVEGKPLEVLGQMDLTEALVRNKDYLPK